MIRAMSAPDRTDTRPASIHGRMWTIRKCQSGYVISSESDDHRRTTQDHGLVSALDDAKDRVEDLVGAPVRWSHSTLSDTWVAVEPTSSPAP
jgi:hypothetical protein